MYKWFGKTTYGGQLSGKGGTSPAATGFYSPMIQKVSGRINIRSYEGKVDINGINNGSININQVSGGTAR